MDDILLIGTDCTLSHGFNDYIKYNPYYENGICKSPFASTWIFHPKNFKGNRKTNYYSLGIIADLIQNNFKGWEETTKNYRQRLCCKNYPVEFTHRRLNLNAIPIFLNRIKGTKKIIFCSLWRTYIGFNNNNLKEDKLLLEKGLNRFKGVLKNNYELIFFFVVNRNMGQEEYVKNLMKNININIKYGILYNEKDKNKNRRWVQKFDAAGWEKALKDTGLKL